jgi:hypothetical protein
MNNPPAFPKAGLDHEWHNLDMSERNNHHSVPRVVLQSFNHYIPTSLKYNGYVDSRAVQVFYKDGEEIARFANGVRTYTPRFKELCHQLVEKMFEGKIT